MTGLACTLVQAPYHYGWDSCVGDFRHLASGDSEAWNDVKVEDVFIRQPRNKGKGSTGGGGLCELDKQQCVTIAIEE
ncbi:MAG: hypothetical protein ACLU4N_25230 [Butyricimonas faecihominis]